MTSALNINLFGGLAISIDGTESVKFASVRAELLLVWLALNRGEHRREKVANLFWDERDQARTSGNLRTLLTRLPKEAKSFLHITTQSIKIDESQLIHTDMKQFDAALKRGDQQTAAELFSGEPFEGITLDGSDGISSWMASLREEYLQKSVNLFHQLAETVTDQEDLPQNILYAQKLVRLDPLREASYRVLMRLLVRNGQRIEALKVFDTCKDVLAREFYLEPEDETLALASRIKTGQSARIYLPQTPTRFIGRTAELNQLRSHLLDANKRMVTIVGSGGMGKTRLAIASGEQLQSAFLDGVAFVPLANIDRADQVCHAIYTTLIDHKFIRSEPANRPVQELLCEGLKDKEMLLVLDNLEHLLQSATLLDQLLTCAPSVKLLLTSRARLGSRWETLLLLHGLGYAAENDQQDWTSYDAVQLFLQMSQQQVPGLTLHPSDREPLTEICKMVGGMPLALELASSWLRLHSIPQILAEIKTNIGFLASTDHGLPERHQSIQAVFDYSWEQLSDIEQRSMARLSVFRGRFNLRAAEQITGTDQLTLATLIDHSLIMHHAVHGDQERYFDLHPLIRDLSAERLKEHESLAEINQLEIKLVTHYFGQISEFSTANRAEKLKLVEYIDAQADNISLCWQYGVSHELWDLLAGVAPQFYLYWMRNSMNLEGKNRFRALASANTPQLTIDNRLIFKLHQIKFLCLIGELDKAINEIKKTIDQVLGTVPLPILAEYYFLWGDSLYLKADYPLANEILQEGMKIAQEYNSELSLGWIQRALGKVYMEEGHFEAAESLLQNGVEIFKKYESVEGLSLNYNSLSALYRRVGDMGKAVDLVQSAYEMADLNGDMQTSLNSKRNYAFFLVSLGRFREAADVIAKLEETYNNLTHARKKIGIGRILHVKGVLSSHLGEYQMAEQCFKTALKLAKGLKRAELFNHARLAMLYVNWDRPGLSQPHLSAGFRLAEILGDAYTQRTIRMVAGYLGLSTGDHQAAERHFNEAVQFAKLEKSPIALIESQAGEAAAVRLSGDSQRASEIAKPLVNELCEAMLAIQLQPIWVYLSLGQALQVHEPDLAARVFAEGLALLEQWRQEVPDGANLSNFRSAVPAHRDLLAMRNKLNL